jgi:hypothetical protein
MACRGTALLCLFTMPHIGPWPWFKGEVTPYAKFETRLKRKSLDIPFMNLKRTNVFRDRLRLNNTFHCRQFSEIVTSKCLSQKGAATLGQLLTSETSWTGYTGTVTQLCDSAATFCTDMRTSARVSAILAEMFVVLFSSSCRQKPE